MSQEISPKGKNTPRKCPKKMSQENSMDLSDEELRLNLDGVKGNKISIIKKHRRQQGIFKLINQNPRISMEEMAEKLGVNERTIKRDLGELNNVIQHVGPTKNGVWKIIESTSFKDKN